MLYELSSKAWCPTRNTSGLEPVCKDVLYARTLMSSLKITSTPSYRAAKVLTRSSSFLLSYPTTILLFVSSTLVENPWIVTSRSSRAFLTTNVRLFFSLIVVLLRTRMFFCVWSMLVMMSREFSSRCAFSLWYYPWESFNISGEPSKKLYKHNWACKPVRLTISRVFLMFAPMPHMPQELEFSKTLPREFLSRTASN